MIITLEQFDQTVFNNRVQALAREAGNRLAEADVREASVERMQSELVATASNPSGAVIEATDKAAMDKIIADVRGEVQGQQRAIAAIRDEADRIMDKAAGLINAAQAMVENAKPKVATIDDCVETLVEK